LNGGGGWEKRQNLEGIQAARIHTNTKVWKGNWGGVPKKKISATKSLVTPCQEKCLKEKLYFSMTSKGQGMDFLKVGIQFGKKKLKSDDRRKLLEQGEFGAQGRPK